jgi:hypothetical protein
VKEPARHLVAIDAERWNGPLKNPFEIEAQLIEFGEREISRGEKERFHHFA